MDCRQRRNIWFLFWFRFLICTYYYLKQCVFIINDLIDEERDKRLHVEIKPLSNGAGPISASVDELRATVENISLLPLGTHTLKVTRKNKFNKFKIKL